MKLEIIYIAIYLSTIGILCFIFNKKLKHKQVLDEQLLQNYNNIKDTLSQDIEQLTQQKQNLSNNYLDLSHQVKKTQDEIQNLQISYQHTNLAVTKLEAKRSELINSIELLNEQQKISAKAVYEEAQKNAEQAFEIEIENISNKLNKDRSEAQQAYLTALEEINQNFQEQIASKTEELRLLDAELAELKHIVASATEDRKRAEEKESQLDFYRLQLSNEDINEIKKLREVLPYLRDSEPLNKVIYKVYYEKPYQALVARVIGPGRHTGIYKITNINDGKIYIGQSVDLAERFRQHIKRGVGAEPVTRNKLYPAMIATGIENFTFEVMEECSSENLNNQEQYWINYFQSQLYGYNVTKGGA